MNIARTIILSLMMGFSLLVTSCNNTEYINLAKIQSEKYYYYFKSNNIDSILPLYSREFYAVTDSNTLSGFLKEKQKDGTIISAEFDNGEQKTGIRNGHKYFEVKLVYKSIYSSGKIFAETFYFTSDYNFSNKISSVDFSIWEE